MELLSTSYLIICFSVYLRDEHKIKCKLVAETRCMENTEKLHSGQVYETLS